MLLQGNRARMQPPQFNRTFVTKLSSSCSNNRPPLLQSWCRSMHFSRYAQELQVCWFTMLYQNTVPHLPHLHQLGTCQECMVHCACMWNDDAKENLASNLRMVSSQAITLSHCRLQVAQDTLAELLEGEKMQLPSDQAISQECTGQDTRHVVLSSLQTYRHELIGILDCHLGQLRQKSKNRKRKKAPSKHSKQKQKRK